MIRMVHKTTGTTMWVHESRLFEYLEAGHQLASPPEKPAPTEPVKKPRTRTRKTPAK